MHAVLRETYYDPDRPIQGRDEFKAFQAAHAEQSGYVASVVVDVGDGRFATLTIWRTPEEADRARIALAPVIEHLLTPLMTTPPKLLGTGDVVLNDLTGGSSCK